MALKAEQKVTMITFDQTKEDVAKCTTYNKTWIKKLDSLCESHPESVRCVAADENGMKCYQFPRNYIKPPRAPKAVSEETKRKSAERLRKLHAEGKI